MTANFRFFLLSLCLLCGVPGFAYDFTGGTGIDGDPYLVASPEDLNAVRDYSSAYFEQTADIDLNVIPYNETEGWVPIDSFSGRYDVRQNPSHENYS
jgi:hypothetical protein